MNFFSLEQNTPDRRDQASASSEPGWHGPDPLPDREWGLSAAQVFAVVVTIIAVSQVIGLLF